MASTAHPLNAGSELWLSWALEASDATLAMNSPCARCSNFGVAKAAISGTAIAFSQQQSCCCCSDGVVNLAWRSAMAALLLTVKRLA